MKSVNTLDTGFGLTLVELVIVIAVLSLVLVIILPGFGSIFFKTKIQAQTSRLAHALAFARSEAIHRNDTVSVCPVDTARNQLTQCNGSYGLGWMVYTNRNRDRVVDQGQDELLRVYEGVGSKIDIYNRTGTRLADELITYYPDGTARRNLTFLICVRNASRSDNSAIIVNNVGRVRRATNFGHCP